MKTWKKCKQLVQRTWDENASGPFKEQKQGGEAGAEKAGRNTYRIKIRKAGGWQSILLSEGPEVLLVQSPTSAAALSLGS
jgi:hypothetical protein